ncbi:MAG: flavin monoamine oxidase family protein, partial [Gammaproteobacteria bacterium]
EARDYIGGRVHAMFTPDGKPMEMGAAWIHDADNSPLTPLAESFGNLTLVDTPYALMSFREDGVRFDEPNAADTLALGAEILADVTALAASRAQASLPDTNLQFALDTIFANQSPPFTTEQLRRIACMTGLTMNLGEGTRLSNVSLYSFGDDGNILGVRDDMVLPTYATLIEDLGAGVDVRFNQVVSKIAYTGNNVTVTASNGVFSAPQCVVAMPVEVLKSGNVTFSPALPQSKQDSLNRIGRGLVSKLYLGFPSIFWDADSTFIMRVPESFATANWVPWVNVGGYLGTPLIMGFNSGDYSLQIESMTDADVVNAAFAELQSMFGNSIPAPTYYARSHWPSDPYSMAAWPYLTVGATPDDYDSIKATVGTTLYFAGDGTSRDNPRSVRGAYTTGQDAANAILTYRGLI